MEQILKLIEMEKINNQEKKKFGKKGRNDGILIASILILAGIVLLAGNIGLYGREWIRVIFSWQSLLILLGIISLVKKQYEGAVLLGGIGIFFMIPLVTDAGRGWISTYWPALLIVFGILFLVKVFDNRGNSRRGRGRCSSSEQVEYGNEDGYIECSVRLGQARQIVLDPVFRGGSVCATMAGALIDLRKTDIENGDTFLNFDCKLAGVELYVPGDWNVITDIDTVLSGIDDKRYIRRDETASRKNLVLTGKIFLGGIEIKE